MKKAENKLHERISQRSRSESHNIAQDFPQAVMDIVYKVYPIPHTKETYKPECFSSIKEIDGSMVGIIQKDKELICCVVPMTEDGRLTDELVTLHAQSYDYDICGAGGRTCETLPAINVSMSHYKNGEANNVLSFSDDLDRFEKIKELTPETLLRYCVTRKNFIEGSQGSKHLADIRNERNRIISKSESNDLVYSVSYPETIAIKISHKLKRLKDKMIWQKNKKQAQNCEKQNTDTVIGFLQNQVGIKASTSKNEEAVKISSVYVSRQYGNLRYPQ